MDLKVAREDGDARKEINESIEDPRKLAPAAIRVNARKTVGDPSARNRSARASTKPFETLMQVGCGQSGQNSW